MADLVTNPVDLSATTPTTPQTRVFADWKTIPVHDRVRFARRSAEHPDGGGSLTACLPSTDQYISNYLECGHGNAGSYNSGSTTARAKDGTTAEYTVGYSFPSVNQASEALNEVLLAMLIVRVDTVTASDTFTVSLESPLVTSAPWSGTKVPDSSAITKIGTDVTGIDGTTVSWKFVDVTAQVQAAIDHANWTSGDYLNFMIETDSAGGDLEFGSISAGSSNNPPRLEIMRRYDTAVWDFTNDLTDAGFTNVSNWTVSDPGVTVSGGVMTIPTLQSATDTGVTLQPNTAYEIGHGGTTLGSFLVTLGDGTTTAITGNSSSRHLVMSGPDVSGGMQLSCGAGNVQVTGPFVLNELTLYDQAWHPDVDMLCTSDDTFGGIYAVGPTNYPPGGTGTHPQWVEGVSVEIFTDAKPATGAGNGSLGIDGGNNIGVYGVAFDHTYRVSWGSVVNSGDAASVFQVDLSVAAVDTITGTPSYVDILLLDGLGNTEPWTAIAFKLAGDAGNAPSGTSAGIYTFTKPLTITKQ